MRNPLRSEGEAFRFLIAVIVCAVVIVAAAYVNTWLGVAAAVIVVAALGWWLLQEPVPGAAEPPRPLASETPAGTRRVLVVASPETSSVSGRFDDATEVVVLVPALASTVEALTGAVDDRRAAAQAAADRLASRVQESGSHARGEVGADDPILAIEDALRTFGADEIVIADSDESLVDRARERFAIPVSRAGA